MIDVIDERSAQELIGGGDTRLHFHLEDRTPTHLTLEQMQSVTNVGTQTGNYTATPQDDIILVDTSAGNVTVTLPLAKGGKEFEPVKAEAANVLYVVPTAPDTILGSATGVIIRNQYDALRLKSVTGGYIAL